MRVAARFLAVLPVVLAAQLLTAASALAFHTDPLPDPEPPFAICEDQRYALCAAARCFVYNGVAYCQCVVTFGDSISLQLEISTPGGTKNVCDINARGKGNGFMVSTYSLPAGAMKGGPLAAYTCPGSDNKGSGVEAPVAYGQCDGGLCFTSSLNRTPLGLAGNFGLDITCSCPISTASTPGSSNPLGYQMFGPYHPKAPVGQRCDPNGCSACNVANPTANGSVIPVGAPTGAGRFLTEKLTGSTPTMNECLCECPSGGGPCTVAQDTTP